MLQLGIIQYGQLLLPRIGHLCYSWMLYSMGNCCYLVLDTCVTVGCYTVRAAAVTSYRTLVLQLGVKQYGQLLLPRIGQLCYSWVLYSMGSCCYLV